MTIQTTTAAQRKIELPAGASFITDGGLETTLVFHDGIDLPDFAAFPLLDTEEGRVALANYYEPYFRVAERDHVGFVADTPTWRASADWGSRLGYDSEELAALNQRAVEFVRQLGEKSTATTLLNGVVGPRGDGYVVGEAMTSAEAARYHGPQVRAFADAGVDLVTAVTLTYVDEAIGIVQAARSAEVPVAISFTVETDGSLPSGVPLSEAIRLVDDATESGASYFMVNCAHPSHFAHVIDGDDAWVRRIKAIRANASEMSHEELDNADELDRGDPTALAADYVRLQELLPELRVVGGCCGTDPEHISAISTALHGG